jgi:hypothetical protein
MRKLNRFLFLLMFASILLLDLPGFVSAQGQCDAGPTITEEILKDPMYDEIEIALSQETVAANSYVNAWIGSGFSCPPYQWSLVGTGFHFRSVSGPTTATTYSDDETLQVWADGTACGAATVVVSDQCDRSTNRYVRGPGTWNLCDYQNSAAINCTRSDCSPPSPDNIFGKYKFQVFCTYDTRDGWGIQEPPMVVSCPGGDPIQIDCSECSECGDSSGGCTGPRPCRQIVWWAIWEWVCQ